MLVVGPRQCGKSTLVHTLRPGWRRLDLERPADLALLQSGLEGFFQQHSRHVTIDEAQRLPQVFPALRHFVDRSPGRGRYLLTGSASPALMLVSSHTVAGDLEVLEQTFMLRRLPPYNANVQKRLTKSPKLYLRDTGLLHFLAGLRQPGELAT